MRTGIIRNIPPSSVEAITKSIEAHPSQIIEVKRLQKRATVDGTTKLVPSSLIIVKFKGQILPKFVYIFKTRQEVNPFIPNPRTCYKCYRIGHIKPVCRGSERYPNCGCDKHKDEENCPMADKPPTCINCKGNHIATSPDCPIFFRHKQILSLAASENIPLFKARKIIRSNTPTSVSHSRSSDLSSDPKVDYRDFPRLNNKQPENSYNHHSYTDPLPSSFYSNNKYDALNNINSYGFFESPRHSSSDSYANAVSNQKHTCLNSNEYAPSHLPTSNNGSNQGRGGPSLPRGPAQTR
ncbi:uncharacterized protein LOC105208105 [Solenopsis invicta]|uniref:uncharacterized protein LOC105208105 n=1 Tax=Solenopsis invicta TaxID=13686 RepID=UPI00059609CD|nr:uncharacterized protein LOC105208105 [Solenopsis invicta]